MVHPTNAYPAF